MPKSLSSAVIAVIVCASWMGVAIQGANPMQAKTQPVAMDLQKQAETIANLVGKVRTNADAAGAPQGRAAMGPLIGTVSELQQGLTAFIAGMGNFETKNTRMGNFETKKTVDDLKKQAEALKQKQDSLMKLSQQKSDDARARASLAQQIKNLTNDLEATTRRLGSTR
jgi:hypothetical protein